MPIPETTIRPSTAASVRTADAKDSPTQLDSSASALASTARTRRPESTRLVLETSPSARLGPAPDDPASAKLVLGDSVESLHRRGYVFQTTLPDRTRAMLVPAQLADSLTWRVGFENFYAITRYNRSPLYAMAVHDLAQEIAARYRTLPAETAPPSAAAAGAAPATAGRAAP